MIEVIDNFLHEEEIKALYDTLRSTTLKKNNMKKIKIADEVLLMQYKINADSPYNDGWTQKAYRKQYEKLLKKIKKKKSKK